jgi:predicted amidohydrolase
MSIAGVSVSSAAVGIRRYSNIAACREHLDGIAREAVAAGSRLLVLPELLCSGLLWTDRAAADSDVPHVAELYRRVLTPMYPAWRDLLSNLAVRHGLTIAGATFWHVAEGRALNTGLWCRPDGSVLEQDKLHPTRPERAIGTVGGDDVHVVDVEGHRAAMLICYDIQFPEVARWLTLAGVELLVVPSLTDARGECRVRLCAQARAVENQLFVCIAPLVGNLGIPREASPERRGTALIACPIDNRFGVESGVLATGGPDAEGLANATLDFGLLRQSREKSEITQLLDRRPELYARIAKPPSAG